MGLSSVIWNEQKSDRKFNIKHELCDGLLKEKEIYGILFIIDKISNSNGELTWQTSLPDG